MFNDLKMTVHWFLSSKRLREVEAERLRFRTSTPTDLGLWDPMLGSLKPF